MESEILAKLTTILSEIQKIQSSFNWLGAIKDVVLTGSAIATVIVASLGLNTWRRQLKGKSEYQLAKEVLMSVYRVKEAFIFVRNPVTSPDEYHEKMINPDGSLKNEYKDKGLSIVFSKRFKKFEEAVTKLKEKHLEAQVEWGAESQDIINPLYKCRVELYHAVNMMLLRKKDPGEFSLTAKEKREERATVYYSGANPDDQLTPQINKAIKGFEEWLRPHIKSKR